LPAPAPRGVPALGAALARLEATQLRRERLTISHEAGTAPRALRIADGRELVDFSSNDYLGLARHPAVAAAMAACTTRTGAGSGASHLITGHGSEHARLEEELAAFTGRERALLFSTGYMANLAVMTALTARGQRVLLDRLSHASLIDGARLADAELRRYGHLDADSAERLAAAAPGRTVLIGTDGVFSMDGDLAPLPQLAKVAQAQRAWLVVDDAHGLGVIGATGGGVLEHYGLGQDEVPVLVGTLGKAFGSFGAFVAGPAELIEFLIQRARSYIYTTALPQPVAAASRAALALMQHEGWRRTLLQEHVAQFRALATAAGLPLADSATPIQPVLVGSAAAALQVQAELAAAGLCVTAIRPPTVPTGSARLRVTLSAEHTAAQLGELVALLARACARVRDGRT
jgi:8-amino-7-oxononanoate synthase